MSRARRGLVLTTLLAAWAGIVAGGAVAPVDDGGSALVPGARGTMITVLQGNQPVEIPLTFLGTYQDFAGPGFDVLLVQLEGPAADRVGVASGMSGSPVYFDGQLVGALAYRLGGLPTEPVGGVTPIDKILDADRAGPASGPAATGGLTPIATPLVAGGLEPAVREWLAPQVEELGFVLVSGGGGGANPGPPAPLEPGSPVGAELVRGDLRIAATGTVTMVRDDRVYAFGHPFLGAGRVEMPMVAAEVIHTLADMAGSVKLSNVGRELGAIVDDRRAAVVGRVGQRARMVPVRLEVRGGDYGEQRFSYEVVRTSQLVPLLSAVTVVNSLRANNGYSEKLTLTTSGVVRFRDLPDLQLEMAHAGGTGVDPGFAVASELVSTLGALWTNPYSEIDIEGIELAITARSEIVSYRLEDLRYDRERLRPGERIEVDCVLRRYRGELTTERLSLELPGELPGSGNLTLAVGNPTEIDALLGGPLIRRYRSANDMEAVVRVLGDLLPDNRLTAVIFEPGGSVVAHGAVFSGLPPTAQRLLETQAPAGPRRRSPLVSPLDRAERELDGPVHGVKRVRLRVDRHLEARELR